MAGSRVADERPASWKVLLPGGIRDRVLVLGCDEGIVSSLSRTFNHVETCYSSSRNYDIVVLNCSDMDRAGLSGIVLGLGPASVIVSLNENHQDIQILNSRGFNPVRCYAGLPAAEPRLYIPLNNGFQREKGLAFHHPGSSRARFGIRGLRFLSRLGITKPLMGNTVKIYMSAEESFSSNTLVHWLSEKIGYEIADLVVYAGSELEKRKITALGIAENRGADVVVKIADTKSGAAAIGQESSALHCLQFSPLSGQVPKILFEDKWRGYAIQGQSVYAGKSYSQTSQLSPAHYSFLADLSRVGRQQMAFGDTSFFNSLKQKMERIPMDDLPAGAGRAWQKLLGSDAINLPVICHRTHGDFTPWNVRQDKNRLFVYDWEESLPDGLAGMDAFNFVFRQADLIGPWPGNVAMINTLLEAGRRCLSAMGKIDNADPKIYLLAWLMNEYAASKAKLLAGLIDLAVLPCRVE